MKLIIIILGSLLLFCLFLYFDKRSRGRGKKLVGTLKMFREIKFNSKLATRIIGGVFAICLLVYWAPSIGHWFEASAQKSSAEAHALAVKDYGPAPCIPQYQTIPDKLKIEKLTLSTTELSPGIAYVYFRDSKTFDIQLTKNTDVKLSFVPLITGNPSWEYTPALRMPGERSNLKGSDLDFKNSIYYITTTAKVSVVVVGKLTETDPNAKHLRSLH